MSKPKKVFYTILYVVISFILGVGFAMLMPRGISIQPIRFGLVNVDQEIAAGLPGEGAVKYSVLEKTNTMTVVLYRLENDVRSHSYPHENHVLYITKGKATMTLSGVNIEAAPGMLIFVPQGMPHGFNIEGEPLEFVLFATPVFNPNDVIWPDG